ncbi:unnamed protein product [Miscanthus lutarioriparius]|uniref:Sodium/calcium exchanger membrane region domain-containing protein n=1 Tax=Miscanthus lutarioriparius TaxID=422564 RepID=A0A811PCU2_9POAL|nr:unnamed protein product [Miscanthus lutarioriparius]
MEILKWSLLGSILSNLLLVLGSSLLCGGLANTGKERPLDRRQADVSVGLLMLGVLCHILPLLSKYTTSTGDSTGSVLELSRLCAIVMLIAYFGGLVFQLKTHRQFFVQEESSQSSSSNSDDEVTNNSVIGSASTVIWLIGMTVVIAVLSNYIITTIEEVSDALGIPVRFISIILLPVVGNAAEHAGAIIFAFKNKIDITLGIALGSATQILLLVNHAVRKADLGRTLETVYPVFNRSNGIRSWITDKLGLRKEVAPTIQDFDVDSMAFDTNFRGQLTNRRPQFSHIMPIVHYR